LNYILRFTISKNVPSDVFIEQGVTTVTLLNFIWPVHSSNLGRETKYRGWDLLWYFWDSTEMFRDFS